MRVTSPRMRNEIGSGLMATNLPRLFFLLLALVIVKTADGADIHESVAEVRSNYTGLSLMAFAVNGEGSVCASGSDGDRIAGVDLSPVVTSARWHIGSCTKSMTAVLMAILVERGHFTWKTTLSEVLSVSGTPYDKVSLKQLMGMRACIPGDPPDWWVYHNSGKTLKEQRKDVAMDAMQSTPTHKPGSAECYSNWGYVVAGHIIEETTGMLWEDLVTTEIFGPLNIPPQDIFFGPPDSEEDAWGHSTASEGGGGLTPCDPTKSDPFCDNPAVLGPAGTFAGRTAAMQAYLSWHLRCHNNKDASGILTAKTCRMLHTPIRRFFSSYAMGWICVWRWWAGGMACNHGGSNTLWTYNMWIAPGIDRAFVAATNAARGLSATTVTQGDFFMTNAMVTSMMAAQYPCEDAPASQEESL